MNERSLPKHCAIGYSREDLIYFFALELKGFLDSKETIYHAFKSGVCRRERVEIIKREYCGNDYSGTQSIFGAQCFIHRVIVGYTYDRNGININFRDKNGRLFGITATWEEVEQQIEKAISNGEYFNTNLTYLT